MAGTLKRLKQNDERSDSEMHEMSHCVDEKKRAAMDSHCEIERRRRNKMAALVNELSDIIPACNSCDKRKPDKLTILKLAVDHLKALKFSDESQGRLNDHKTSFLTDVELKKLVLEATSGFLFVVVCATGKVIYVSDTVSNVLGSIKVDWDDVNLYDLVHPADRGTLRTQLEVEDHELLHTQEPPKSTPPGSETSVATEACRRSFIIKMRTDGTPRNDGEVVVTSVDGSNYVVLHVTGYIKHWPNAGEMCHQTSSNSQSCLIAIGHRKQRFVCADDEGPPSAQPAFLARNKTTGVFTFVDCRVTKILGYKPVDLLQRSIFQFCQESDHCLVEETFAQVAEKRDQVVNVTLRFINSSGILVPLRMSCSAFLNPFSGAVEYISSTFTHISNSNNATDPKDLPIGHANFPNHFLSAPEPVPHNQVGAPMQFGPQGFGVDPTHRTSVPLNQGLVWVNQQQQEPERNPSVNPPDYHHHHLNMYSLATDPGLGPYQCPVQTLNASNPAYRWSSPIHSSANQINRSMNGASSFISANQPDLNIQNCNDGPWNSFAAANSDDFSPVGLWQNANVAMNNGANEMTEVINFLSSSSSSSAFFEAMDGSGMKKYCP